MENEAYKFDISDFADKIAPIYKNLNWGWWDVGVPTADDIRKTLNGFFEEIKNSTEDAEVSTGGLFMKKEIHDDDSVSVEMGMEVSESLSKYFNKI